MKLQKIEDLLKEFDINLLDFIDTLLFIKSNRKFFDYLLEKDCNNINKLREELVKLFNNLKIEILINNSGKKINKKKMLRKIFFYDLED